MYKALGSMFKGVFKRAAFLVILALILLTTVAIPFRDKGSLLQVSIGEADHTWAETQGGDGRLFDPEIILEIFRLLVEKGYSIEALLKDSTLGPQLHDFLTMLANHLRVGVADPLMKGLDPGEAAELYLHWVIGFLRNNPRAYEAWLKLLQQAGTVIGSDEDRREFQVALTLILGRQIGYKMATDLLDDHLIEFVEGLEWLFANAGEFSAKQWQNIMYDVQYFLDQLASIPYSDKDKYIEHLANWATGLIVYGEMLRQLANGTITGIYGSWNFNITTIHPGPLLVMEIQQTLRLVGVEGYLRVVEAYEIVQGFRAVVFKLKFPTDFIGFIALLGALGAGQELATELDRRFDMPIWVFVCEGGQCRVYYANMSKEEAEQLACSARLSWCSNGHPSGGAYCIDCAEDSRSRSTNLGGGSGSPAWIGGVRNYTYATGICFVE